jgi:hypothetical protein
MPRFLVRVSRAFWHSGTIEITAQSPDRAEAHALELADDIELKDWGETVELWPRTCRELEQEGEASESGSAIVQQALCEGELVDESELRRLSLEEAIRRAQEQASMLQNTDPQCSADHIQLATWLQQLHDAQQLAASQAEDEGLWCAAKVTMGKFPGEPLREQPIPAPEAMLQQALRLLHVAVEGKSPVDCVQDPQFIRAGGDVVCNKCGKKYYEHAEHPDYPFLTVLCDGSLVKL